MNVFEVYPQLVPCTAF